MNKFLPTIGIGLVMAKFLAPRTFTMFDRRVARTRMAIGESQLRADSPRTAALDSHPVVSPHEICELLASAVLAGESSRDALSRVVAERRVPLHLKIVCERHLMSPEPFESVIGRMRNDLSGTEQGALGTLLALSVSDGVFVSGALKHSADLLRHDLSLEHLIATHTAHARITMRVLSMLPVVFLALGCAVSPQFVSAVFSPIGVVCTLIASILNIMGWLWASRLVSRVGHSRNEDDLHLLVMGAQRVGSRRSLDRRCMSSPAQSERMRISHRHAA